MDRFKKYFLFFVPAFLSACGNENNNAPVYLDKVRDTQQVSTIDVHPQTHKAFDPEELKKNKASVFIFLSPDCPLCQGYVPTIKKLMEGASADSIRFYAVFPGKGYSDEEVKKFFTSSDLQMAYFIDDTFMLTDFMKATITPQAFIVDRAGQVIYGGRIDNWAYEIGKKRTVISEHDLENALNDVRAGRKVKMKSTEAVGCIIEKKE